MWFLYGLLRLSVWLVHYLHLAESWWEQGECLTMYRNVRRRSGQMWRRQELHRLTFIINHMCHFHIFAKVCEAYTGYLKWKSGRVTYCNMKVEVAARRPTNMYYIIYLFRAIRWFILLAGLCWVRLTTMPSWLTPSEKPTISIHSVSSLHTPKANTRFLCESGILYWRPKIRSSSNCETSYMRWRLCVSWRKVDLFPRCLREAHHVPGAEHPRSPPLSDHAAPSAGS